MSDGIIPRYKIEDGIPVPAPHRSGRPANLLWKECIDLLDVGQSVLVPIDGRKREAVRLMVISTINYRTKRKGSPKKFVTRSMPDGIRVWRIE